LVPDGPMRGISIILIHKTGETGDKIFLPPHNNLEKQKKRDNKMRNVGRKGGSSEIMSRVFLLRRGGCSVQEHLNELRKGFQKVTKLPVPVWVGFRPPDSEKHARGGTKRHASLRVRR